MMNLLRADFLKIRKDRATIIALLVLVFFAVVEVVIASVSGELMNVEAPGNMQDLMGAYDNGRSIFLKAFYISNNVGILIPIILVLFVGKEFNYGTMRNKLVTGQNRTSVYLSSTISSFVLGALLVTFYAVLTLILGSIVIGYGFEINGAEIFFLLKAYFLGLLIYMVSFSVCILITYLVKNQTYSIIISLVFLLIVGVIVLSLTGLNETLDDILSFTMFGQSLTLMSGNLTNSFVLKTILTSVIAVVGITSLGVYLFKKSDLK